MKKTMLAVAMVLFIMGLCGCASIFSPVNGFLFTDAKYSTHDYLGGAPGGQKFQGEACAMSILGLVAIGDASVEAALKAAGVQDRGAGNVRVDTSSFSVLSVFTKHCVIVTGFAQ